MNGQIGPVPRHTCHQAAREVCFCHGRALVQMAWSSKVTACSGWNSSVIGCSLKVKVAAGGAYSALEARNLFLGISPIRTSVPAWARTDMRWAAPLADIASLQFFPRFLLHRALYSYPLHSRRPFSDLNLSFRGLHISRWYAQPNESEPYADMRWWARNDDS